MRVGEAEADHDPPSGGPFCQMLLGVAEFFMVFDAEEVKAKGP